MAEIFIRTDKGEYFPGDTVYGAVYLQVASPTSGDGIMVSFTGYEAYLYSKLKHGKTVVTQHKKNYMDIRGIPLYTFTSAIPLGQYVFPFKHKLPMYLPGTFAHTGEDDFNKWQVDISFIVEAYVSGATYITTEQALIVKYIEPELRGMDKDKPITSISHQFKIKRFMNNGTLTIIPRLDKLLYSYDETAYLDVDVECTGCKVNIQSIDVKLMRRFYLKGEIERSLDMPEMSEEKRKPSSPNPDRQQSSESCVVFQTRFIRDKDNFSMRKGVSKIAIPLCHRKTGLHVSGYPTSCSAAHYVDCLYWIDIVVEEEKGMTFGLSVPKFYVSPRSNEQWHHAHIPRWCNNCQLLSSKSVCSVTEQEIASEQFSGLPGFLILEMR